ncbi:MAG TPA: hypothetical protein VK619_09440 [Pyrinomonadaceae bacterium]|nr:hypothetical protein [Pyrinomonadaceae bacterium]
MKLIELTVIYLAAGSPFVAHRIISAHGRANLLTALAHSTVAFLLWPLTAISFFLKRGETIKARKYSDGNSDNKVEAAGERLTAALHNMCESAGGERNSENLARSVIVARDAVEKYICLTLSAEDSATSEPYEHEMEFYRVAGRKGADLKIAVGCLHRRNHERIVEHRARARTELLHALVELREIAARDMREHLPESDETSQRDLSVMSLKLYGHALDLFSLAEDERGVGGASRLIEAECARLRRLEREVAGSCEQSSEVDESCKTHAHHLAFTGPSQTRA